MKKFMCVLAALCLCGAAFAGEKTAPRPEGKQAPAAQEQKKADKKQNQTAKKATPAEQKKAFEARRKQIKKLVKKYRKASEEEKPAIKEQLSQIVSESVDAGLAYVKARIAAERANLDNWETKLQEDEKNLAQIKAKRVEDLLSGEAKRKHKAAQKAWKKQMKEAEKQLN